MRLVTYIASGNREGDRGGQADTTTGAGVASAGDPGLGIALHREDRAGDQCM